MSTACTAAAPSPSMAARPSICRNTLVSSGSRPATILNGLAGTVSSRKTETTLMILIRNATLASLSPWSSSMSISRHEYSPGAKPVSTTTAQTMACRYLNGGRHSLRGVSRGREIRPPSMAMVRSQLWASAPPGLGQGPPAPLSSSVGLATPTASAPSGLLPLASTLPAAQRLAAPCAPSASASGSFSRGGTIIMSSVSDESTREGARLSSRGTLEESTP
mmetsp:Transcript_8998/g.27319  ORF Transcript_8998/g.27319 Transcript_8998/m.27319 type:complete len:220 (-) Transcript_8998:682-1341(-)